MDVGCTGTFVPIDWVEVLEVLRMLATQVFVCLPIGWVEELEVLRMLHVQVRVCLSVGLKCWRVLWMLDAQVLVCLSVGLKCRKFCWESCANTLYVSTIFFSEKLAAQVLGVRIDWFEVLEVLEGECCVDNWVGVGTTIHPEMVASLCAVFPSDKYLCACISVGLKCWKFWRESVV